MPLGQFKAARKTKMLEWWILDLDALLVIASVLSGWMKPKRYPLLLDSTYLACKIQITADRKINGPLGSSQLATAVTGE